MQAPWTLEVLLLGRAESFPDSLYILQLSADQRSDLIAIAPSIRRYYAFAMRPFTPAFEPHGGTYVVLVSLHRIRGFDFMGNVQIRPAMLAEYCVVRYTYALEAQN